MMKDESRILFKKQKSPQQENHLVIVIIYIEPQEI